MFTFRFFCFIAFGLKLKHSSPARHCEEERRGNPRYAESTHPVCASLDIPLFAYGGKRGIEIILKIMSLRAQRGNLVAILSIKREEIASSCLLAMTYRKYVAMIG